MKRILFLLIVILIIPMVTSYECEQQSANVSVCYSNGLGTYLGNTTYGYWYDENWNSGDGGNNFHQVNYTKPIGINYSSQFKLKTSTASLGIYETNILQLPINCINYTDFLMNTIWNGTTSIINAKCYNGTAYEFIQKDESDFSISWLRGYPDATIMEESMIWQFNPFISFNFSKITNASVQGTNTDNTYNNVNELLIPTEDLNDEDLSILWNLEKETPQTYWFERSEFIQANLTILDSTLEYIKVRVLSSGNTIEDAIVTFKNGNGIAGRIKTGSGGLGVLYLKSGLSYIIQVQAEGYVDFNTTEQIIYTEGDTYDINIIGNIGNYTLPSYWQSNCLNKVTKERNCYLKAQTSEDTSNITIKYNVNGTNYSKECLNNDYCKTDTFVINNGSDYTIGNLYLDGILHNHTINISYIDLGNRSIQIMFNTSAIKEDPEYLMIFYVITLIIGLFLGITIESKIKGWGIFSIIIWFSIIAINGFLLYWLIVLPTLVLKVGQLIYRERLNG